MPSLKSNNSPTPEFLKKLLDELNCFFADKNADIQIAGTPDVLTNHRHCWYEILFYRKNPDEKFQKLLIVPPHTDHTEITSAMFRYGIRIALGWELFSGFCGEQMICDFRGNSKLLELLIFDMEQIILCRDGNLGQNTHNRHLENMKKDFSQVFETYLGSISHIRRQEHIIYAKNYLRTNAFRPSLQMSEIAAHIGVSLNTLPQLFRKYTGMTARRYLINTRLSYACECLAHYDILLQEVAKLSGWSDYTYFVKSFQKQFGMTPGKMASKLKNKEITLNEINSKLFPPEEFIPR